jgi:hypothetical protein
MNFKHPLFKRTAIALAALVAIYLLAGWLLLPRLLQSQAEQFVAERTGHRLSMGRPDFNPLTLSLRLHDLKLTDPQGAPLLSFKELLVDLSASSLLRRAWVFDAIRLDGPEARIVDLPHGRLNWTPFIDALQGPPEAAAKEAAPSALPRLGIASLIIAGGGIDLVDQRGASALATRIEPLDLELDEFSTVPDETGKFQLTARTIFGAKLAWQGTLSVNPLAVSGHVKLDDVSLAKLTEFVKPPLRLAPPEGRAGVSTDYRLTQEGGHIQLSLDQLQANVRGLVLRARPEAEAALKLDSITLDGGHFDLRQHSLSIGSIALAGGALNISRSAAGRLSVLDFLPPTEAPTKAAPPAAQPAMAAAPASAWHYRIEHITLSGLRADLRDEGVKPAANLSLQDVALAVDKVSEKFDDAWPVKASFTAAGGGRFEAQGEVIAATPSADLQIKLSDLSLKPVQPYLGAATTLTLASGALSVDGRAHYAPTTSGFNGSLSVKGLRLVEKDDGHGDFLAWKSLDARRIEASPTRLRVGELALAGLNAKLLIAQDRTTNLSRVIRQSTPATTSAPAPAAAPTTVPRKTAAGQVYRVDVGRVRIAGSEMDFADYSLALPFGTHIHHLHGTINGLSTRPGAPGQLEIAGQVDDYGTAGAAGQVNLFDPTDFMDIKVLFRNIEMTHLTPYSATFAGRKIASGKLSLDLEYKIKARQLEGDNKVVMDQLTLGERVDSPQAKNLPLDLALALLRDSDGRIDLGLPVSGSLDDPQFSYGAIVWKAIVNVVTKIATAPFRALGNLFGGGQSLENVAFEPGRDRLAPPQKEKLVKLAAALVKRPALALTVHGTYAEVDRVALQDLQLRRDVAAKAGYAADEHGDPGPISTGQENVRSAIEDLYAERIGRGELAALKDGFRKANPGQLPESGAGRLISRLGNAFRAPRELPEGELAQLKGADFYLVLYQRMRDKVVVPEERLLTLAAARGQAALAQLKTADAPSDRIALAAPEKIDIAGNEVMLKMELKPGAAAVSSPPPAAPSAPAPAPGT